MRSTVIRIAVPNSLLFLSDARQEDFPVIDSAARIWQTSSCIAVLCRPDVEGETEITIGRVSDAGNGDSPLFDGVLDTPSRELMLEIVPGQIAFRTDVPSSRTHVRIWTDGHRCADRVAIGLA